MSATMPGRWPRLILGTTALASLVLAMSQARAETLNVTANVGADCSVQAGSLEFGNYDPDNNKDAAGSFTVTCTVDASVVIGLDRGINWDGTSRNVGNEGGFIPYHLYKDAARADTWGNDAEILSKHTVAIQGGGTARTVDVYGRLLASGPKVAGEYTDVVNITFSVN